MTRHPSRSALAVLFGVALLAAGCGGPEPGTVLDEAKKAGRTPESLAGADEDYFADMDYGYKRATDPSVVLTKDEIRGRNNWIAWTAGNDRFWDYMSNHTYGAFDLLKILSSYEAIGYCTEPGENVYPSKTACQFGKADCEKNGKTWHPVSRDNRWSYYGLVNEPCFDKASGPDKYGLWLDKRRADCPADPFENEQKYPGVKIGARGDNVPVGSYYGKASGIVGLRVFPNPDFTADAQKDWDPERYYNDPTYYNDKNLVRPYRVGMSCGFCHVGPNPSNPPKDPEHPERANLTSNPGAQYFWVDRIFVWNPVDVGSNFIYQLFHTSLPGSLDTSFVSTDNINNPRTMNAVYNVLPRLVNGLNWKEKLAGGGLDNKQFGDYPQTNFPPLTKFYESPDVVYTPRVLKDGADSVGALGALNRVYLNIGLFSEEWLLHFNPLVGGKKVSPIEIAVANKNSVYWQANQMQTPDLALFFVKTAQPDKLAAAPGGQEYLKAPQDQLDKGKIVFAENCARCHSSKQPANLCRFGEPCKDGQIIPDTAGYFDWMRAEVMKPDFLEGNFLSTERRVSIKETGLNACAALATNGIRDDIWDNFTSETYKQLPPIGKITVHNPIDGTPYEYEMPGGGRGYIRPASLVSLWSSAPYLLNNTVGKFNGDPSVKGRMDAFQDGIGQMLWPERRARDIVEVDGRQIGIADRIQGPSQIFRTKQKSYIKVPFGALPDALQALAGWGRFTEKFLPWLFDDDGDVVIGPIPEGTPVNLLANLQPLAETKDLKAIKEHYKNLLGLLIQVKHDLKALPRDASNAEASAALRNLVPRLLELNKCPDFVVNKGHYFGSNLPDPDKLALIEFLKTF